MKRIWLAHLPWLIGIALVALFLTRNLWSTRALIETHDGIFHLVRQEVFASELKNGQLPVRWAGTLDNGFGLPLFNYVYPGPYYLGAPLSLLGLSSKWVIKIIEVGMYAVGGLGIYALFAKKNKSSAIVAAILYLTTPYLLLNVFVRGALGEFMAISLIPWVLVALADMTEKKTLAWYHPLPYFALFISHNFLSFLFLPIYLLVMLKNRAVWKTICTSLGLSLGLAAFFILPMIVEQGLLHSVASGNFTYSYADHFVYPRQLIIGTWGNGPSLPGEGDGLSFALGVTSLIVLAAGLLVSLRKRQQDLAFWLLITLTTLFFLLPVSLPLWQLLTPLQLMQFPWRLLSITTITIPITAFYLLATYKRTPIINIGIAILLGLSIFSAYHYSRPPYFQNNEQLAQQLYVHREKTTTSSRLEVLPRWGSTKEQWIGDEHIKVAGGNAQIMSNIVSPSKLTFTANSSDSNTKYEIKRNYFPSWKAQDETGKNIEVEPSANGELVLASGPGTHTYTIFVGSTPVEQLANLISLLTGLYIIASILRPHFKQYIDEHFEDWDISIALRYLPIVDELQKLTKPSDSILEVGSEIRGITTYFKHKITGLDQGFDYTRQNKYLQPVVGSATALPFADRSFDYVISVDCIEHIPPKLRAKAVKEMLRVANKTVYLTFPVGKNSEDIDRALDTYFYHRNGEHFIYLTEHVENGLPSFNFVPDLVAKYPEWKCKVQGNTSTWLWVILLKMGFSNVQWQTSIYRRLLLFLPILKHCNFTPCYRQLYVLTRKTS